MSNVRILAFAGSLRSDSFNKKLIRIAAAGARAAGAQVTEIDLRDIPMPLYDGDIERDHGLPPNAKLFKRALIEHHGMPDQFAGIQQRYFRRAQERHRLGLAHGSRTKPPLVAFKGKIAGLMSASTGHLGGVRGLAVLTLDSFQHRRDRDSHPAGDRPRQ